MTALFDVTVPTINNTVVIILLYIILIFALLSDFVVNKLVAAMLLQALHGKK
jgi:hypothetical protein